MDSTNEKTISLDQQFELVKTNTFKARASHVQQYGKLNIGGQPVGNFIGLFDLPAPVLQSKRKQSPSFLDRVKSKLHKLTHGEEDDENFDEGFGPYSPADEDI